MELVVVGAVESGENLLRILDLIESKGGFWIVEEVCIGELDNLGIVLVVWIMDWWLWILCGLFAG